VSHSDTTTAPTNDHAVRVDWDVVDRPSDLTVPTLALPLVGTISETWMVALDSASGAGALDAQIDTDARTLTVRPTDLDDLVGAVDTLVREANATAATFAVEDAESFKPVSAFRLTTQNPERATTGLVVTGDQFYVVAKRTPASSSYDRLAVRTNAGRVLEVWATPYAFEGVFVGPDTRGRNDGQLRARLSAVGEDVSVPVRTPRLDGLLQPQTHVPLKTVVATEPVRPGEDRADARGRVSTVNDWDASVA
jgi:hypothetical protein